MSKFKSEKASKFADWASDDKPREKLLSKGKAALSDSELLAILLGSGSQELSVVELSRYVLSFYDNDLNKLARSTVPELMKFKGIGEAKAISVVSALELGRRRKNKSNGEDPVIKSSEDVYEEMKPLLQDLQVEEFWVLMLTRANKVIKKHHISSGGISGTISDPKIIFKYALDVFASAIILAHNHPSGNIKPSKQDMALTKKIKDAGAMLELPVLDHIIFTDHGYYSFADEGLL